MTYLADPLPFDGCSVQRALGGATEYALLLVSHVRGMVDDASSPCPRPARQGRSVVLVDSVRFEPDTARVYVTVLRGELIHRENYALNPERSSAAYMGVREVRSWGHTQAYPGRGRAPAGTAPPE
jgi:hypothetical protein